LFRSLDGGDTVPSEVIEDEIDQGGEAGDDEGEAATAEPEA
jgi:hypothetical protein